METRPENFKNFLADELSNVSYLNSFFNKLPSDNEIRHVQRLKDFKKKFKKLKVGYINQLLKGGLSEKTELLAGQQQLFDEFKEIYNLAYGKPSPPWQSEKEKEEWQKKAKATHEEMLINLRNLTEKQEIVTAFIYMCEHQIGGFIVDNYDQVAYQLAFGYLSSILKNEHKFSVEIDFLLTHCYLKYLSSINEAYLKNPARTDNVELWPNSYKIPEDPEGRVAKIVECFEHAFKINLQFEKNRYREAFNKDGHMPRKPDSDSFITLVYFALETRLKFKKHQIRFKNLYDDYCDFISKLNEHHQQSIVHSNLTTEKNDLVYWLSEEESSPESEHEKLLAINSQLLAENSPLSLSDQTKYLNLLINTAKINQFCLEGLRNLLMAVVLHEQEDHEQWFQAVIADPLLQSHHVNKLDEMRANGQFLEDEFKDMIKNVKLWLSFWTDVNVSSIINNDKWQFEKLNLSHPQVSSIEKLINLHISHKKEFTQVLDFLIACISKITIKIEECYSAINEKEETQKYKCEQIDAENQAKQSIQTFPDLREEDKAMIIALMDKKKLSTEEIIKLVRDCKNKYKAKPNEGFIQKFKFW